MDRSIIHLNIADFAVAVERRVDRRLNARPVIIAPQDAPRAAVYDMSEEAYQTGVRKHMPLRRALRLCRDATLVPPHPDRYERTMQALVKQALPYSPLIEIGEGDGHLFVDVTGTSRLFGPPVDVAWRLRRQVRNDLRLDPIWSLAPNKLVAKVATRLVKPSGEYIVGAGEEAHFLAPLPLGLLPGIEHDDFRKLQAFNLTRVGELLAFSLAHLETIFANRATLLYEVVRGIDPSPVRPMGQAPPVIATAHEFSEDTNDRAVLESVLYRLIEQAAHTLRRRRLAPRRVQITLDYTDGVRSARRARVTPATTNDQRLYDMACQILHRTWTRRVRLRHLRLTCDQLIFPSAQLALFASQHHAQKRQDALVDALDGIRQRFGQDAIRVGRTWAA
jgi:DNA polymerase-4